MNDQNGNTCRNLSWLAGLLAGVLVFLYAWRAQESGMLWALFIGLIVFIVVGWLLIRFLCEAGGTKAAPTAAPAPKPAATPAPEAAAPAPKPAATPAPEAAAPAPKPAPAPAATKPEAAPAKPAPAPAAEKPAPAAPADASDAAQPPALSAARGGKADDLKQIKGIGPGLEKALNEMGIYHFDQIAAWSAAEIAWVDDNLLRFKGRATRDNWVAQAKDLAAGSNSH
ncbi:MAG: hypothetical protein KDK00_11580 [Rhodobacteraceae bacterium]|nr:hypothetical protein [Paracoccaceae bacterium]